MAITSITIENFKCIGDAVTIRFARLLCCLAKTVRASQQYCRHCTICAKYVNMQEPIQTVHI